MNAEGYTAFGRRLSQHLEQRHLTQAQFAAAMVRASYQHGSGQQIVSNWLRERWRLFPDWFPAARRALRLSDDEVAELLWLYYIEAEKEEA